MSKFKILALLLVLIFISCKNESAKKSIDPEASSAAIDDGPEIPRVPEGVMLKLYNECTSIDYIFHNLPFSLSQNEDPSIDQNISFIDYEKPLKHIPKGCKPIGRKFFLIKGQIVYDVDVYLTNSCKFYVFVDKNNKPLYANYMTENGVKFYSQIAQQAAGVSGQQQQQ